MGGRCGSDPVWLWRRPAAAAPIQPLAQELPYAAGMTVKRKQFKKFLNTAFCVAVSHNSNLLYTMNGAYESTFLTSILRDSDFADLQNNTIKNSIFLKKIKLKEIKLL